MTMAGHGLGTLTSESDLRAGGPLPPLPGTPLAPLKLPPPPGSRSRLLQLERSTTFRKLHSQPVPVVVVAVPGIDRILGVPDCDHDSTCYNNIYIDNFTVYLQTQQRQKVALSCSSNR